VTPIRLEARYPWVLLPHPVSARRADTQVAAVHSSVSVTSAGSGQARDVKESESIVMITMDEWVGGR